MWIRRVAFAALLSSSAIVAPSGAQAAPVFALIGNFAAGLAAGLSSGAWGAAFFGGSFGIGAALGGIVGGSLLGRTLLGIGLSSLAQAVFRPKVPSPSDRMVNYAQPISYLERGYGRVRKGGPFAFAARKGSNRHYGVIVASHRTKGPVTYYLDKWQVEINGGGDATTAPVAGYANLRPYRGLSGQAVDAIWDAAFAAVTSAHNFAGMSYLAATAKKPKDSKFAEVYPSGREWSLTPVWDMHDQIYDPRDETYKWTDNLALIIAHELVYFGRTPDWTEVIAEANICDQLVTNGEGGSQKRWTYNGVFDDSMSWEMVRSQLMLAGDVFFFERPDGITGFRVGRYIEPDITLTDRDILSMRVTEGSTAADIAGRYVVRYVEPSRDYIETPSASIQAGTEDRADEIEAFGISSHNQACRVAKRMGRAARSQFAVSLQCRLIGYDLIGKRFVRIAHAETGFTFVLEIGRFLRNAGALSFTLEGVSVVAEDFAFVASTEEPPRPAYVVVASDGEVAAPAALSGTVIEGTGGMPVIEWSWPVQDEALTQQIQMRSLDAGITDWQILTAGEGQSTLIVQGLVDGASYEAQVRNRSSSGRLSGWAPASPIAVTAVADSTAPGALTGFTATPVGGDAEITYVSPNSANYAATRIWRAAGSTLFSAASLIRTEFGAANTADLYLDPGLAPGSYSYWGEAINGSGIAGVRSGPETITII